MYAAKIRKKSERSRNSIVTFREWYIATVVWAGLVSPFEISGSPNETSTKGSENDVVALLEFLLPFPKAEGNGCGGRITIFLDVDNDLLHRDARS